MKKYQNNFMINKNYTKEQYLQIENRLKERFWMSNNHFIWDSYSDQPQKLSKRIELLKSYEKKGVKR